MALFNNYFFYLFRSFPKWRIVILMCIILQTTPTETFATYDTEAYEISVFVNVYRVGGREIPAIIIGDEVLLSVSDLFNFLKIKNVISDDYDSVSGFFNMPTALYVIDKSKNRIEYKGKIYPIKPNEMVQMEAKIYLNIKHLGAIFELHSTFDYRNLSVSISTKDDLPIIREIRQENMRANIKRVKGEKKADTNIARDHPLFSFGMADWALYSGQKIGEGAYSRLRMDIGSVVLGGETEINLNLNTHEALDRKQQSFLWRYVDNDFKMARQVMLGQVNPGMISTVYEPVVGVKLTNTPTSFRKFFGTYTITDYTNPNWIVELYINNVLVDYKQADASGFYAVEVPLIYGSTEVELRFYGPWGERQTEKKYIKIPYNFIPKNKLEYNVSGGYVRDDSATKFSHGELNYGLSRNMTIGGGVEYLASVHDGKLMPFAKTSISLAGRMLITADYTHEVRARGALSYRFASGTQLDFGYINYAEGQQAIRTSYLEERKAMLTIPFRKSKINLYARFSVDQYVLPTLNFTNIAALFSFRLLGVSTNFNTYFRLIDGYNPFYYTRMLHSARLSQTLIARLQYQYDYSAGSFISTRFDLEKRFAKNGYLSLMFETNYAYSYNSLQLGLRYDFSFAQTSAYVMSVNDDVIFFESARGSFIYEGSTGYLNSNSRLNVGRGGLIIIPFLDVNNNGCYDKDERRVQSLDITLSGGRVKKMEEDTTVVVTELNPYTKYLLEFSVRNVDNIAWQLDQKSMRIEVNPNQMRVLEIPIAVKGEVVGMVYLKKQDSKVGQERMLVNFYDENNKLVKQVLTEFDGYFSYLGLAPGKYSVRIDEEQLKYLKMEVENNNVAVVITASTIGDYIDDVEFILTKKEKNEE